jgi:hypothetical protein
VGHGGASEGNGGNSETHLDCLLGRFRLKNEKGVFCLGLGVGKDRLKSWKKEWTTEVKELELELACVS